MCRKCAKTCRSPVHLWWIFMSIGFEIDVRICQCWHVLLYLHPSSNYKICHQNMAIYANLHISIMRDLFDLRKLLLGTAQRFSSGFLVLMFDNFSKNLLTFWLPHKWWNFAVARNKSCANPLVSKIIEVQPPAHRSVLRVCTQVVFFLRIFKYICMFQFCNGKQ